ncbi:MAG: hypothetical protein K9N35_05170 [Candidatus Marinimicrobia bacterium]|nr:hypothetical protein [Candidatus Neomarinimicrobiota bacterium]
MRKWKSISKTLLLITILIIPLNSKSQDIMFDVSNSFGAGEYLLGSRLVENASYATSAMTISSVLSDNSRAYLDLSHSQIIPQTEYSSSQGEIGLQLRYLEWQDNQLYTGLYAYLNQYADDYSYYNSSGFGLYGKWKHYFSTSRLITAGYDLEMKKFDEIAEASNTQHNFYAIYNHSFRTKTSLNLQSAIAVQDFWPQTSYEGTGRFYTATVVSDIPNNTLFSSELRLSQSLGPKLGLTLWLGTQTLLNDVADSLSLQDGLDNPFIDNYRWEGPSVSSRAIYRVNSSNSFKISHSYVKKSYLDVPVYLFDFTVMDYTLVEDAFVTMGFDRIDEKNQVNVQWSKVWDYEYSSWLSGLEVILGLGYTQNMSNDALYDYNSMSYNIGLNFNN